MKREIKFRGKSLGHGHWITGYLAVMGEGRTYISRKIAESKLVPCIEVDPATVGQYTGLKDRTGREIYEDDIIEIKGQHKRVVVWDKMGFALMPCEDYHDKTFWVMNLQHPGEDWWETFLDEIEVIGNIYDNPELIK